MTQRKAHGNAAKRGALLVDESLPFDELPRPNPQPDTQADESPPLNFREGHKIADKATAKELGRRGGEKRALYARILRSIGFVALAPDHSFYTYELAGQEFADEYTASLAEMFDGKCGGGPRSVALSAGLQLAVSRYFYDIGKQTGDAEKLGQASKFANDSRINAGNAYELQSREAEGRAKRGGMQSSARPWMQVVDDDGKPVKK